MEKITLPKKKKKPTELICCVFIDLAPSLTEVRHAVIPVLVLQASISHSLSLPAAAHASGRSSRGSRRGHVLCESGCLGWGNRPSDGHTSLCLSPAVSQEPHGRWWHLEGYKGVKAPIAEGKKRWIRAICIVKGLGGMSGKGHLVGGSLEWAKIWA